MNADKAPARCIASGWVVNRAMTNRDRLTCPAPSCARRVTATPLPWSGQLRVILTHQPNVMPATTSISCVADQIAQFFYERGLLPVAPAAATQKHGLGVHAAMPVLPQVSLCARGGPKRPCTTAELVVPPCRACLKANIHWLTTGRWSVRYVQQARRHLNQVLDDFST